MSKFEDEIVYVQNKEETEHVPTPVEMGMPPLYEGEE